MTLPNGLQIIVIERHETPVASVSLNFLAGSAYDAAGREGLSALVAEVLTKGTPTRTADEIAATIEGSGGHLRAESEEDVLTLNGDALRDQLDLLFELLGDITLHATFPESELDLARTRGLSELALQLSEPANLADRVFTQEIYGASPYGRSPTEQSYRAITRDDAVAFARARLKPSGAWLVVAGDVTLADVRALVERVFAGWTGALPPSPPLVAAAAPHPTDIVLVHRRGAVQSVIVAGNTTALPTDPAYYAARVVTRVLGGGADSRLFRVLREERSWTYDVGADLRRYRGLGYWSATAAVRTEATDSALQELLAQVHRTRTQLVPDSELATAKGYLVGSFPLSFESASQIAHLVGAVKLLGLGDTYLRTVRERLAAVTAIEARRAAERWYHEGSLTIVVLGDASLLAERLKAVAPVRIVDGQGQPLALGTVAVPRSVAFAVDTSALAPHSDSFVVTARGRPIGGRSVTLARMGDSLIFSESLVLGTASTRQLSVVLDPLASRVERVDQTGATAGQAIELHVRYTGGRVTGTGTVPSPAGVALPFKVDTTVPPGSYDDHALAVLVPALPLAPHASINLPLFSARDGAARTVIITVDSVESVTVPAGTFQAFRVHLAGGDAPLVWYVTQTAPRRVVRSELVGTPLVFELVR